jgi:hypothetical protein
VRRLDRISLDGTVLPLSAVGAAGLLDEGDVRYLDERASLAGTIARPGARPMIASSARRTVHHTVPGAKTSITSVPRNARGCPASRVPAADGSAIQHLAGLAARSQAPRTLRGDSWPCDVVTATASGALRVNGQGGQNR